MCIRDSCFLKVLGKEDVEQERSIEACQALFEEVLVLSIRCGGDTDTIASMACALAGAALGQQAIAPEIVARCDQLGNNTNTFDDFCAPGATSLAMTRKLLMMTIILVHQVRGGDEMRSLATSMWEIVGGGLDDGSEAKKPRL